MRNIKPRAGTVQEWGKTGENNAAALVLDVTENLSMWPDGQPQAVYKRQDGASYPVLCELVDGVVRVVLTSTETAVAGIASLEVQWLDNGVIAKSVVYTGRISQALVASETPPDPPGQTWLEEVLEVGRGVQLDRIAVTDMRGEVEDLTGEVRDIAQGVEAYRDATHGYMERAEAGAVSAEGDAQIASNRAAAADGSALRAEAAYSRIVGLELAVDVADGLLCLYSSGLDSPIDIAINGQTLEVWKV